MATAAPTASTIHAIEPFITVQTNLEGLTTLRLLQQPTKGNRNQDVFTHNDGWNN
ncbi:hypothetical protein H6G81_09495 [Scytonema hofmannii FACHB-248]|uniref:Uncharacterized protein n=1 Tax=Scytonema hofmannii FACHB-248 TaxID=1842502 RepID=A0ABR8GND2_9CYAN|nr:MULTISPECIES: hypothetical protein [Nostocales]MBD2604756.1 hypothetical protein [Scytonema hofmannii FACHB-248]